MFSYRCSGCSSPRCFMDLLVFHCWWNKMLLRTWTCGTCWTQTVSSLRCDRKHVWNREYVSLSCVYLLFSYFTVYWVYCFNTAARGIFWYIFLRFYLGFLYFLTIQILIQPLQYCVMARWLAGGRGCVADESLTVLYVNKYKVFIFHRLLQHAK